MTVEPAALSVNDAAVYLGISRATLYRITAERGTGPSVLRPTLIGGRRLFQPKHLDAYLDAQTVKPARCVRGVA